MSTIIRAVRPPEEPARSFAYRVLVFYISELFFQPGERLVESEIAAQLGVSRTPVHDTFLQLSHEKLLTVGPRSACVPLLRPDNVRQLCWMHRTTGIAVLDQLFTHRPATSALEPLERCVAAEYDMLASGSLANAARLNWEFYAELYKLAGYYPVYRALYRAGSDLYRLYRLSEDRASWQYITDQNALLVQALGMHNHEDACVALTRQFDLVEPMLEDCRRRVPQYFV
ncbi:MAG: GntR family transcriptional regulator [Gemmiger sp.]